VNPLPSKVFLPCYSYDPGKEKKVSYTARPTQGRQMPVSFGLLGSTDMKQTFSSSLCFEEYSATIVFPLQPCVTSAYVYIFINISDIAYNAFYCTCTDI